MNALMLEGTWEEIRSHDAALAGRRVKLIIMDSDSGDSAPIETAANGRALQPTLAEMLAGRIGKICFDPPDLSVRTEEAFAEIMDEKYQARDKE